MNTPTAISSATVLPLQSGASSGSSAGSAAKFAQALGANQIGVNPAGNTLNPNGGVPISSQHLTAADDAWVKFLALSERLNNPQLTSTEKGQLMSDLTDSWHSFQSQSGPIAKQLTAYVTRGSGA